MTSDLSRDTFVRARHFSSVRLQQGRVVTDADWNEQADLTRYRAERAAGDLIGRCGAPVDAPGFGLVAETNALSVHALNANVAWIGAEDGVFLRTTNGGADWTPVDRGTRANVRALAEVGGTGWAVGDGGVVRKTMNQGASWIAQTPGIVRTLRAVSVFDADHAWAAGDGGIVVATSDGGATWRVVQTSAAQLDAVQFTDELAGLAAGRGGAILSTSDGGQTWNAVNSGTTAHLRALAVFGTTRAWAAGQRGTIVRSEDGGATWLPCNTPATGTLYAIRFRDQNEGWAAGQDGVLLHTVDGGATWTLDPVAAQRTLRALAFFGNDPGWLVGDGSMAFRIGGGSPDVVDLVLPAVNLSILPGRLYVNGTLCELETRASYGHQPDGGGEQPLVPGAYLIYADVWQRHISALEEPAIREVALGGPDTATRARTVAQVRAIPLPPSSPFDWNCSSQIDEWDALVKGSRPVLAARAEPQLAAASLCEIAATAGYRRLENQLYRVEIHEGGATPTFKWSRENGSVAYAVEAISTDAGQQQTTVRLAARGRDDNLDVAVHDRVELIDDDAALGPRAGVFFEYLNDGDDELELVLGGLPTGTLGQDPARHPILRRWDHKPTTVGSHVLPIVEGTWIELEEGVQVRFGLGGQCRPGDFWQIPARTIIAKVEWALDADGDPIPQPPAGITDAYCRLGIIDVGTDGTITVVADCRNIFAPIQATEQLLYVSGDGQDAAPGALLPQPVVVRVARGEVPVAGRVIRFEIENGGGTIGGSTSALDVVTDADGQAWCDWRLGVGARAPARFQRLRATLVGGAGQPLPGQFVVFCATASLTLRCVSGDGQNGAPGAVLPFPLEVQVVNGADGIAGAVVRAIVENGGGTITGSGTSGTNAEGHASFTWQLGSGGPQRVRIELLDGTGQVVQRLGFDAGTDRGSAEIRGCDVTVGDGGQFERLTSELLRELLERGRGHACVCLLPGVHAVPEIEVDGAGNARLSLHGCGHATLLSLRGSWTFRGFAAIEIRDLSLRAEQDTRLLFQRNAEVRLARVQLDRSESDSRTPALNVVGAQTVNVTGCEILARMPLSAAMFQDIEGDCRIVENRFVGAVSFYGVTEEPPTPDLLRALADRDTVRLQPGSARLSFCDNDVSQLSVSTEMARRLASTGTAQGVFASAVLNGNTVVEQNSIFVAGLLGVTTNAFLAQPPADGFYGVMLSTRAAASGNVATVLVDRPLLHFIVQDPPSFAKAANVISIRP